MNTLMLKLRCTYYRTLALAKPWHQFKDTDFSLEKCIEELRVREESQKMGEIKDIYSKISKDP